MKSESFYTDWCGWCKKLDEDTYTDKSVLKLSTSFVCIKVDADNNKPLGARFGAFPVSGHFWNRMRPVRTPLAFVCAMGLTFESANLDFALEQAAAARAVGDEATARVIEAVRRDEVRHVAFGWRWFERLRTAGEDAWDAYRANLAAPLSPATTEGSSITSGTT